MSEKREEQLLRTKRKRDAHLMAVDEKMRPFEIEKADIWRAWVREVQDIFGDETLYE